MTELVTDEGEDGDTGSGPGGASSDPSPRGPRGRALLSLFALGVVFGDIGTSPLYSLQTAFGIDHGAVRASAGDVLGVISLVFWSITIVVSVKYVVFVMRADNGGEGGVIALVALVRETLGHGTTRATKRTVAFLLTLGILGASLFYGDSVITPAISVLSAVEGTKVAAPGLAHLSVPISVAILVALFAFQRFGTGPVGRLFGPVMLVWFAVLALTGLVEVVRGPGILRALSPTYAVAFGVDRPYVAFIAMGAVVLSITGAEALYADIGHFGRKPITLAWLVVVLPALTLSYLGQGALILREPSARSNPFFLMGPHWSRVPMVVLATMATIIASQAVITGAFSMTRQAVRLGLLPHLTIRHTSRRQEGQVYLPAVNWLLFVLVVGVVLGFRSSGSLATAYGVAVTGTFLTTTTLFLVVAEARWQWPTWQVAGLAVLFGSVEVTYFAANLTKISHGGWLPLAVAAVIFTIMTTWEKGHRILARRKAALEGPLEDFVRSLGQEDVTTVPGIAIFPHPSVTTTPLALRSNVEHNRVRHQLVVIVSARTVNSAHVAWDACLTVHHLQDLADGIVAVDLSFGFMDRPDIPKALRRAAAGDHENAWLEGDFEPEEASYFLSKVILHRTSSPGMSGPRKRLFIALNRGAADQSVALHLPEHRTVELSAFVDF